MRYREVIERSNIKHPSLEGIPTKLVFTSLPQSKRIHQVIYQKKKIQVEKLSKDIHLPIMSISDKAYIPLMRITG
jgi:hypothetical protein